MIYGDVKVVECRTVDETRCEKSWPDHRDDYADDDDNDDDDNDDDVTGIQVQDGAGARVRATPGPAVQHRGGGGVQGGEKKIPKNMKNTKT